MTAPDDRAFVREIEKQLGAAPLAAVTSQSATNSN
jgi:hypothetical protein